HPEPDGGCVAEKRARGWRGSRTSRTSARRSPVSPPTRASTSAPTLLAPSREVKSELTLCERERLIGAPSDQGAVLLRALRRRISVEPALVHALHDRRGAEHHEDEVEAPVVDPLASGQLAVAADHLVLVGNAERGEIDSEQRLARHRLAV